jgi:hypothetical protein
MNSLERSVPFFLSTFGRFQERDVWPVRALRGEEKAAITAAQGGGPFFASVNAYPSNG